MTSFQRFYLWGMHAKFFMGLYFTAMVFFVGLVTLLFGGKSIALFHLLEILLVSVFIAFAQALLLPEGVDFTRGPLFARCLIWLGLALAAAVSCAYFFAWFGAFPAYTLWIFAVFMLFGCTALLLGEAWERQADSQRLNRMLEDFNA